MITNIIKEDSHSNIEKISNLLQVISPEPSLEILLVIGEGEACVCHLEAVLGYRQAYISQHLMELREAGLLETRRDGKYVYYHLSQPEIMKILRLSADIAGLDETALARRTRYSHTRCECPSCAGANL